VTHPDAAIHYISNTMYLHIHSDVSYLSEAQAPSHAGGDFFFSSKPADPTNSPEPNDTPPPHNGAVYLVISIMRNILASATEAEYAKLFYNVHDGVPL
jgi:hypothetical protein